MSEFTGLIGKLLQKGDATQEKRQEAGGTGWKSKAVLVLIGMVVVSIVLLREYFLKKKAKQLVDQRVAMEQKLAKLEEEKARAADQAKIDALETKAQELRRKVDESTSQIEEIDKQSARELDALRAVDQWDAFDTAFGGDGAS